MISKFLLISKLSGRARLRPSWMLCVCRTHIVF
jgi:hypothetical protein